MKGKTKSLIGAVALFVFLLWFWPNFVHEPAHWMALRLQGVPGYIDFDIFHIPAAPSITRDQVHSVVGGLFFLLAPSILSAGILGWLVTRKDPGILIATLAVYLGFDMVVNALTYRNPISDYLFLTAIPAGFLIALCIALAAIALSTGILIKHLRTHWEGGDDS